MTAATPTGKSADTNHQMAKIQAEHATAGKYHLDTSYNSPDRCWDWWAKGINPNSVQEYTGSSDSLEGAKRDACACIGLTTEADWKKFGPPIDIPD